MRRLRSCNPVLLIVPLFVIITLILMLVDTRKDVDAIKVFDADVKLLRLNTEIHVSDEETGEEMYIIKGNILRILTDPLTLYDTNGKEIAFGDDAYHIIAQDTHVITSIYGEEVKMVGNFSIWGDNYDIYVNDQKVAHASFNAFNTHGELRDTNNNLMADYSSRYVFMDYVVQVTEYNIFSDEVLNMIFASYYSDQAADSNNNKSSSN